MTLEADFFPADTVDLLRLFEKYGVRYLVIGGRAVNYHAYTRTTADSDLFFAPTVENSRRVYKALKEFWGGEVPAVEKADELVEQGIWLQLGYKPARIDLLNRVEGIVFEEAWERRVEEQLGTEPPVTVFIVSRKDLIKAKKKAGRYVDKADLEYLQKAEEQQDE